MNVSLGLYGRLSRLPFPKSYLGKFLLVAFVGVHVPLIALVGYTALKSTGNWNEALPVLTVALLATLAGTGVTLWIQAGLLSPLLQTARALEEYRLRRELPKLPTEHRDEAGVLMASAQKCVTQLDSLLTLKSDLLKILSHDLRNPLGQVMIANDLIELEMTKPQPDVEDVKRLTDMIRYGTERQQKLMEDLLLLAQSEREAISVSLSETDLAQLLGDVERSARLQAQQKGVGLQVINEATQADGDGDSPRLLVDLAKTGQVLNNLVHNAVKFTPTTGVVTLRAEREVSIGRTWLTLTVEDTGIGMNAAIREGLFVPFGKSGRAGTHGEASSGLGLWICKTFTEAQGGEISVQSEAHRGSRFTVRLPWKEVAGAGNNKPQSGRSLAVAAEEMALVDAA